MIYKVLVRPGRESNSRPTSTEADALTTRPRAGEWNASAYALITLGGILRGLVPLRGLVHILIVVVR